MEGDIKVLIKAERSRIWEEAIPPLLSVNKTRVVFAAGKNEIDKEIIDTDIFLGGHIPAEQIKLAEKLKLIQFYYSGVDSLDFDFLRQHGIITVCNTHANNHAVSELAWALLLAAAKKVLTRDKALRAGVWMRGYIEEQMNVELYNKTLGVIGLGSIGSEIGRVGKAFGMKVIGTKRDPSHLPENLSSIDRIYKPDRTAYVCTEADYTIVAVPLTPKTRGLINREILTKMKGKILVNVSRGAVVDEEALYRSLTEGILAGAGLDTWYNYPHRYGDLTEHVFPSDFPFQELSNVVLSPHIGGFSVESHMLNTKEAVKNAARFIKGEKPHNIVDFKTGY